MIMEAQHIVKDQKSLVDNGTWNKNIIFITKMWISNKPKWSSNWIFLSLQALQLYILKGRRGCKVIESLCHFAKILQLICCSQMQFIVVWTTSLNFFPWGNPNTLIVKQVFKWSHYLLHHRYNQFLCQITLTMHNSQYQIVS